MVNIVCEVCGSDDLTFDFIGVWNKTKQDFDIDHPNDAFCNNCQDIVPTKEIPL